MRSRYMRPSLFLFIGSLLASSLSCGGGGGGGGDAASGSSGVTRKTAIRIIHGAIDVAPLGIQAGGLQISQSRFLGPSTLASIAEGPNALQLSRRDRPAEVLQSLSFEAAGSTEYTAFVSGSERDGTFVVNLLTEPVQRPEKGMARVRFLNGVSDVSAITCALVGTTSQVVSRANASEFLEVPAGSYQFVASRGGVPLASASVELGDREEVSILTAGKTEYQFVSVALYRDLD